MRLFQLSQRLVLVVVGAARDEATRKKVELEQEQRPSLFECIAGVAAAEMGAVIALPNSWLSSTIIIIICTQISRVKSGAGFSVTHL